MCCVLTIDYYLLSDIRTWYVWDVDFLERWECVQVKVCLSKIALMIIAYSYQTSYIKHYSTKFDHDLFKCQASFVLCVMYLLIMNYTL